MTFNKEELKYLFECLQFHYAENDNIKKDIIDINAHLSRKITDQLYKLGGGK
tara:strand:- start:1009 stop:1164 length:156 start_codon:yes stop_codon:yes gene_type:complete